MSDPPNDLGSSWYQSEPTDVPYFPNQILVWDFFFRFLQQDDSTTPDVNRNLKLQFSAVH